MLFLVIVFDLFLTSQFLFTPGDSQKTANVSVYSALRDKLLSSYDPAICPDTDSGKPTNVTMLITFERLIEVDTKNSAITFESFMILNWTDKYLKWNPNDFQGIDHLDLPPKLIWRPDIVASTYQSRFYEEDKDIDIEIKSNGQIIWIRILIVSFKCKMDLTDYPFDKQQCRFPIFVRFYTSESVNIIPYRGIKQPALNFAQSTNPEWTVDLEQPQNLDVTRNSSNRIIFMTMTLQRRSWAYRYIVVLPYLASNLLIFYAFLLPQSSHRRIFIGVFALFIDLSLITLLGYELGFDSNHNTPYAVKCLSINMIMVGIFLLISVFGSRYIAKSTVQAPPWIQGLVTNGFIDKVLIIQISARNLDDINTEMRKLDSPPSSSTNSDKLKSANDWALFTAILDRLYLIVYTVAFVIYHS